MYLRFISILLFALLFFPLYSQKEDIQFEHLSMKDGLSMNPVMAIIQDKKGFLWFGTQDGLNKYDGYSFKVYKSIDEDENSLSDNFITSLAVDAKNRVWIGTLSGGISVYDYQIGKFKRYTSSNSGLQSDKVLSLYSDGDLIWAGTDKGIFIISEGKIKSGAEYYKQLDKINEVEVLRIFKDSQNNFWMGTTGGLFYFQKKMGMVTRLFSGIGDKYLSNDIILSIFEDRNQQIWIGTLDGLNLYESPGKFKKYFFKERINTNEDSSILLSKRKNIYSIVNNYGGNTIRNILQDNSGNLWLGTDMELIIFNPETEKFLNFKKDLINPTGINDHFIRAMYRDQSDIIWIGTLGNGINKTDLKKKKFIHYQKKINDEFSLPENYVRCIEKGKDGKLWVGTLIGGLALFDPVNETFLHFTPNGKNDGTTPNANNIWSLRHQNENTVWIGTNNGLNKYDYSSGKFSYFVHEPGNSASLSENTVRCIFVDSKNRLWVGTEGGLNLWDNETESFIKYIETEGKQNSLSNNTVWKITEDKKGNLWIATNNGLNKLEVDKNKFTRYQNDKKDKNSLSHNGVRTVFIDTKERLWVGTQNGLHIFNQDKNSFKRLNEQDGLPNAFIYSIIQDKNGLIWITTNKGVASIDPENFAISSYDIYDGLQDYEFNTNAGYLSDNGEIYFGGPSGLNRFNPSVLIQSSFNPPVVITNIKLFDHFLISQKDVNEITSLELNYNENTLFFEFSSLDYSNPSRNRYRYKMEGFDQDWIEAGTNHSAKYTNLDPGQYTFVIQGTNADGKWSTNEKRITITIVPPFWQTTWFYFSSVTILLLFIFLIYKLRVKRLLTKNSELENKIEERTRLIEQEKKKIEIINTELEKLSIVASKTDNAVIITDEKGTIEWINESFVRMHSSLEDYKLFYGKSIVETSSNKSFKSFMDKAIQSRKSVSYESENINFTGQKFVVQSTLTPIFEGNELKKLIIIDTDITDRKKNEEIIREKNKDITDSINYAVRIQQAIFPDKQKMDAVLENNFVFFKPKDIVSGDFYFIEPIFSNERHQYAGFAVGDCTGHGVPGAFMSIIANNFLKQSLHQPTINNPAHALDYVSNNIYQTLSAKAGNQTIRDGMDVAFCVIDYKTLKLSFSGANRPLIIISDNEIKEIKGDSQAVGYQDIVKPFTLHEIQLKPNDIIYLFSDGFADQFGGPEGKKFKYSRFKELLLKIHQLPLETQMKEMEKVFEDWKSWTENGNATKEFEQLDDICVMGVMVA